MPFNPQPLLQNAMVRVRPLEEGDFEPLYGVASDPLIWEQHPNRNRWQLPVFQNFFRGAVESGGALCVFDAVNGEMIGTSRYYDVNLTEVSVAIGYTFVARRTWGQGYNPSLKALMLDHAYGYVQRVIFHVGADNVRSRKAVAKLGARYVRDEPMAYYGEPVRNNAVYELAERDWLR